MAATRRDRNENFFKWEPVQDNRFTRNAPLDWLYEINEMTESLAGEEEFTPRVDELRTQEKEAAIASQEVLSMTPPNDELLRMAERFPPPPEWFDANEERPF